MSQSRSQQHKDSKSPSVRLRAVFYCLWNQDPEGYKDFEDYYNRKMDMLIDYYKEMLN